MHKYDQELLRKKLGNFMSHILHDPPNFCRKSELENLAICSSIHGAYKVEE